MNITRTESILLNACYFLIGFALLSLEVIWGRLTALPLGSSIHAYSITLAAVMGGLFFGAYHGGRTSAQPTLTRLFGYMVCFALFSALATIAFVYLSAAFEFWRFSFGLPVKAAYYVTLAQVTLLVFLPAFFSGAVFPLATQILVPDVEHAGRTAGMLYMMNSMGAIVGCLATGFILIEYIGLKNSALICSLLPALPAALFFFVTRRLAHGTATLLLVTVAVGVGVLASFPTMPYTIYMSQHSFSRAQFEREMDALTVLEERENVHGFTRVVQSTRGRFLQVNNKNESNFMGEDLPTQAMLALLPRVYLERDPGAFLDVGLGTGTTLWVAHKWSGHIDSIEINPNVYAAFATYFFPELKASPKVEFIFQEARFFLLNSGRTYDIIALEPSYPTDGVTASLYTRESFARIKRSLRPGGLVSLFVPVHVLGQRYTEGILKTLMAEFPHLAVWDISGGADIVIVAGLHPFKVGPDEVVRRIDQFHFPHYGSLAGALNYSRANGLLGQIRMNGELPVYTDDRILLELAALDGFLQ